MTGVGQVMVRPLVGDTVVFMVTEPVNLLMLARVRVDVTPVALTGKFRIPLPGNETTIEKSRTVTLNAARWNVEPLVTLALT